MKKYKHRTTFSHDGKRYQVYADTLQELAEKKVRKQMDLKLKQENESNITVAEWTNRCIEIYKTNQAEITRKKFIQRVNHCILEHIGEMRVKDVTPIICQEVLNKQSGKSKAHINEVANALKFIFSHAVFNDIIYKDPTLALRKPKGTYHPRRALTPLERDAVIEVASKDRRFYVFLLMLFCGCRPQEACDCKGSDLYRVDGQPMLHIRGTKTANADRSVPVPASLWELIKNTPRNENIALYSNGKPITADNRPRLWRWFWRQLNLHAGTKTYRNQLVEPYIIPKELTPYCLRHEFCSNLARNGVDIRIAQKLMGHSNISLTANIYTHISDSDILAALGNTLGNT